MNDQIKTKTENEAHISPSELNGGLGICCYGGLKTKTACATCSSWKQINKRAYEQLEEDNFWLKAELSNEKAKTDCRTCMNFNQYQAACNSMQRCQDEFCFEADLYEENIPLKLWTTN